MRSKRKSGGVIGKVKRGQSPQKLPKGYPYWRDRRPPRKFLALILNPLSLRCMALRAIFLLFFARPPNIFKNMAEAYSNSLNFFPSFFVFACTT